MSTCGQDDDEIEQIYVEINEMIRGVKGDENFIIMEEWNARIWNERGKAFVGLYSLEKSYGSGYSIVEFVFETDYQPHGRYTQKIQLQEIKGVSK